MMVSSTLERSRGGPRTTGRNFLLKWQRFLMTATLVISSLHGAVVSEKLVSSSLDANWAHTSLLAETSEFLAAEDSNGKLFWQFIDKLAWKEKTGEEAEQRQQQEVKSHSREFEHALATAAQLLADGQFGIQLLRFALSLRIYSPRVQLHRQIASDLLPQLATQKCKKASTFYEIHGEVSCTLDEAEQLLSSAEKRESSSPVYSVDHVFASPPLDNGLLPPLPLVVLYVDVGRPEQFRQFHKAFAALASQGRIRYVLRHFDGATEAQMPPPPAVSLSGYGVELAIKSTEYKAIDDSNVNSSGGGGEEEQAPQNLHGFNFRALREKHVHLRDQLQQFQLHLAELDELAPLKQWEIADIGMQAAQRVMDAPPEEAISLLMDLAQNFPIRARTLVQTKVRQSFREEIELNQQRWAQDLELGEGESGLWLNGIPVDVDTLDPFQLFRTLRQEHRLADAFARLGFKREYQSVLQAMDLAEDKATGWALDFREAAPEWLNNLDKDKQYGEWGNSVRLLLQPYFPGMIRPIARNLFTLVCILDPAAPESRTLLKTAFSLFSHQVPLRIGFIFAVNDSAEATGLNNLGVALYNVFQFVKMDKGVPKAVHFLQRLYDELGDSLDLAGVHRFFKKHNSDQEVEDVFGPGSDYETGRPEGIRFFRRSGLQRLPSLLVNGVPLDQQGLESPDRIEESILVAIMRQTSALQRAVIAGRLTDRENVQNWVLSQPDALPRLNPRLLGGGGEEGKKQQQMHNSKAVPPIYADVPCNDSAAGAGEGKGEADLDLDGMSPEQRTQCVLASQRYLVRADEPESAAGDQPEPRWLTIWLVADLATASGRQLAQNALKALKKSNQMRLALVHNGGKDKNADNVKEVSLPLVADALLARLPSTAAKQSLNKLLLNAAADEHQWPMSLDEVGRLLDQIGGHGVGMEPVEAELRAAKGRRRLAMQSAFAARELGLAPGQRAVLLNGQIYGPLEDGEQLEPEDFALMEKLAEKWGAKAVAALVNVWQKEEGRKIENPSDLVFKMLSAVNAFAVRKPRKSVNFALEFESVLNLLADESEPQRPTVELTAIVHPLSRSAQKLAPILQTLMKVLNADLRLAMNPRLRLSELPLKRFYRYVLRDQPAFSPTGQLLPNSVHFRGLPQKQLLTLNPIVPDAWMVQPVWANHDLDNIRVATASKDIVARFQLRHILLEGHCFDEQNGNPPRGLQFVLGTRTEPAMFDTIVMANLGYFQLKAGPGAWILRLREGRSKEIYELKGSVDVEQKIGGGKPAEGEKEAAELEELHVLVDSFSGKTIRLRVNKRKGMEKRNLLATEDGDNKDEAEEEAEDQGSIWSNLAPNKVVKKLSSKLLGGEKHEVINIFSLASGHLYERFLRIMMLSVLKNTKHPVKFWLLNNYLSPQFRESLPTLAQHYGFDYQLIEYKWPRWLHQQTEKQRVMWGYKILFLDVLFPLDVKKIIFVDADQVVRTDMMELMEYDLEGAPYGYTPFCHSRTSMDGFRFWKSGYWASHLAGRRYHISALYVVDLVKFRQIAAGDRLRGQYQGLSADPNSLSNLDQDLPNNMIHQVRIHSLPQEWLWCETWCDDVSKAKAKTIDLCNNPQTKEPKLDSAVRIIPEWTELDNEIKQVLLLLDGTTRANVEEEEETGKVDEEDANHQQQHEDL